MDPSKIIIENWPKTDHLLVLIPIIVAVSAIVVSLFSLYFTRKSFTISHRPYICANSYAVPDPENKTIVSVPQKMMCSVLNSPAKIKKLELKISLDEEIIFSFARENTIRFPLANTEWTADVSNDDYAKIMDRSKEEQAKLLRIITIKYSSLGGGKTYHYKLVQSFIPDANQWNDISAEAD